MRMVLITILALLAACSGGTSNPPAPAKEAKPPTVIASPDSSIVQAPTKPSEKPLVKPKDCNPDDPLRFQLTLKRADTCPYSTKGCVVQVECDHSTGQWKSRCVCPPKT